MLGNLQESCSACHNNVNIIKTETLEEWKGFFHSKDSWVGEYVGCLL